MPVPVLLMIQALGIGGTERQFSAMIRSIDRGRFAPHAGVMRAEGFRIPEIEAAGIPIVNFDVRSFRKPSAIAGAIRMVRYIRKHKIRLVHAFDAPSVLFGVPTARTVPGVAVLSSQRSHRELTPATVPAPRWLLRQTDRMADAVLVNCRYVTRYLEEDEGVPGKSIVLCYNGVDTGVFNPSGRSKPPELASASVVIGVVSALRPEKNLSMAIEAFASVRQSHPSAMLVFVGDGSGREELVTTADELGVSASCRFIPATKDVAGWMRAIDIFVLPSVSEAFSNSLMEAMACGCCAVASRVGGNPELVADGETGLLFESRDTDGLANALNRLAGDRDLLRSLADAGSRLVSERFSLAASAERLGEIYTSLLSG
jgi:glycosyltransferase involved in cell wall biosynthesis